MGTKVELITVLLVCLLLYVIGIFLVRSESEGVKSRVIKRIFMIGFFAYIVLLLKYTMFDGHFGREIGVLANLDNLKSAYKSYIATRSNFEPFETIIMYTIALKNGLISLRLYLINILGNIVAFMPLALFLPICFPKTKKFWIFFVHVMFIGLSIEVMQIMFMTGSFDVDDIILNVSGALIAYGIFHTKPIYKLLNKLTRRNY